VGGLKLKAPTRSLNLNALHRRLDSIWARASTRYPLDAVHGINLQ
jgi:hypothetical protein